MEYAAQSSANFHDGILVKAMNAATLSNCFSLQKTLCPLETARRI
jgi:hypothetical protein